MKQIIMVYLLKDKDKAKRLAKEGRKRAEDFEVKKIVKEYEKVFTTINKKRNL